MPILLLSEIRNQLTQVQLCEFLKHMAENLRDALGGDFAFGNENRSNMIEVSEKGETLIADGILAEIDHLQIGISSHKVVDSSGCDFVVI